MKMLYVIKSLFAFLLAVTASVTASAQQDIAMADAMRENGKIYVVVAVIAVVFTGIVIYLITLDRRISKMERDTNERD